MHQSAPQVLARFVEPSISELAALTERHLSPCRNDLEVSLSYDKGGGKLLATIVMMMKKIVFAADFDLKVSWFPGSYSNMDLVIKQRQKTSAVLGRAFVQ